MRLLRALRAFMRPELSRGWPGALCCGELPAIVLADPRDEPFFEAGMQLELTGAGGVRIVELDTFDRRKGRREAFADTWAGRRE